MKLSEDTNSIEINPSKAVALSILQDHEYQLQLSASNSSVERFLERHMLTPLDEVAERSFTFAYNGIYGSLFLQHEQAGTFHHSLTELVIRTNSTSRKLHVEHIDDILFIMLTYTSELWKIESMKSTWKYLDELIELYLQLMERKVNIDGSVASDPELDLYRKTPLKSMSVEDSAYYILEGLVRVESRMVAPDNSIVYIPNDFEVALKPRECDKGKYNRDIIIPSRLSVTFYTAILKEIIQSHQKHNTRFFKMLSSGYLNIRDLENRTRYKEYNRENLAVYNLINHINGYLIASSPKSTALERYAFIYELLQLSGILQWQDPVDKKGRYMRIRDIIRDNSSIKRKKSGETQFFV